MDPLSLRLLRQATRCFRHSPPRWTPPVPGRYQCRPARVHRAFRTVRRFALRSADQPAALPVAQSVRRTAVLPLDCPSAPNRPDRTRKIRHLLPAVPSACGHLFGQPYPDRSGPPIRPAPPFRSNPERRRCHRCQPSRPADLSGLQRQRQTRVVLALGRPEIVVRACGEYPPAGAPRSATGASVLHRIGVWWFGASHRQPLPMRSPPERPPAERETTMRRQSPGQPVPSSVDPLPAGLSLVGWRLPAHDRLEAWAATRLRRQRRQRSREPVAYRLPPRLQCPGLHHRLLLK